MIPTLRAFAGGLLLLAVPIAAAGPREPVALLYQISGEAQRISPGRSPEPLRAYCAAAASAAVGAHPPTVAAAATTVRHPCRSAAATSGARAARPRSGRPTARHARATQR